MFKYTPSLYNYLNLFRPYKFEMSLHTAEVISNRSNLP